MNANPQSSKLCDRLVAFRKISGLSQEEVGARLNLSRQAISSWEKGSSKPSMENLIQLCHLYDVSLEELTGTPASRPAPKKHNPLLIPLIAAIVCVMVLASALIGVHWMEEESKRPRYTEDLPTDQVDTKNAESFDLMWP